MNIFLFEWKKVWKNGAVLKVVLLFLMLSAAIFCVRWHGWSELFPAIHGNLSAYSF